MLVLFTDFFFFFVQSKKIQGEPSPDKCRMITTSQFPQKIKKYSFSFMHNKDPTSTLEKCPVASSIGGMVKYSGKGRRL